MNLKQKQTVSITVSSWLLAGLIAWLSMAPAQAQDGYGLTQLTPQETTELVQTDEPPPRPAKPKHNSTAYSPPPDPDPPTVDDQYPDIDQEIKNLAASLTLTDTAKRLLYDHQPAIFDSTDDGWLCSAVSTGCWIRTVDGSADRIQILRGDYMIPTLAHELLHAGYWQFYDADDTAEIDRLVEAAAGLYPEATATIIALYQSQLDRLDEDGAAYLRATELYAHIGTLWPTLPDDLAGHYGLYFSDRPALLKLIYGDSEDDSSDDESDVDDEEIQSFLAQSTGSHGPHQLDPVGLLPADASPLPDLAPPVISPAAANPDPVEPAPANPARPATNVISPAPANVILTPAPEVAVPVESTPPAGRVLPPVETEAPPAGSGRTLMPIPALVLAGLVGSLVLAAVIIGRQSTLGRPTRA